MRTRRRVRANNNVLPGAAGFLRVLGGGVVFGMRGRVFWSGTMGRAEVRGNQQETEDRTGRRLRWAAGSWEWNGVS